MTDHLLHIFIVTGDPPQKCVPALACLLPDMTAALRITVLSGSAPDSDPQPLPSFDGLSVYLHPGESVWHLRQRMAEHARGSQWMILLEDHNLPLPGWLPQLCDVLRQTPESMDAVFGATDNLTSTGPWDWANYLAVQVFHWAPGVLDKVHPLPFNAAIRVRQLPPAPWHVGTFETVAVSQVARRACFSPRFPVDHIQPRAFPSVLGYHFANGQATGAHLRIHDLHPIRKIGIHLLYVLLVRPMQSSQVIRRHQQRKVLPAGTWWRLTVLLWAHACGATYGFFAGPGRSMWRLE